MFDAKPFLDSLYTKARRSFSAPRDVSRIPEWRDALSASLWRRLGMDKLPYRGAAGNAKDAPGNNAASLRYNIMEETETDGFLLRLVSLEDGEGYRLPCYIVFPQGAAGAGSGPFPAALAVHGHGCGARSAVGLPPGGGGPDFALRIAEKGFVVAVPELLGFGRRRLPEFALLPPEEKACERIASILLLYGQTLAARRVYDTALALDYLLSLPEAQKDGACAMGFSGGAMVCMLSAIFDARIKAAALCSYPNLFKTSIIEKRHCIDNYIPGILEDAEMSDLLSLIAPRPLFLSSGIDDPIFPVTGAREAFFQVEEVYKLCGVEKELTLEIFEGAHEISDKKVYDWLLARSKHER